MNKLAYGTVVRETTQDNVTVYEEERIDKGKVCYRKTHFTEKKKLTTPTDVIAEFLNLFDRKTAGEIKGIEFKTFEDESGNIVRIEKRWHI